jgi:hypothetical protein
VADIVLKKQTFFEGGGRCNGSLESEPATCDDREDAVNSAGWRTIERRNLNDV